MLNRRLKQLPRPPHKTRVNRSATSGEGALAVLEAHTLMVPHVKFPSRVLFMFGLAVCSPLGSYGGSFGALGEV